MGYNYMSLTLIIHEDVHYAEKRSLLWDCACFFEKIHVPICLFIFLYYCTYSTACVDLMHFCLFDMKNVLMACIKPTLHICNIRQCKIEDCVYSCNPPGLPPSWQLSV